MADQTKKLFDAPWEKSFRDWETYKEITIYDSKYQPVCLTRNKEMSNRLAHLPELYDALNKQTYFRCVDCLRHTAKTIDDIPLNKDMIEHGCPKNRTDCGAFDAWPLLKKVRDGE